MQHKAQSQDQRSLAALLRIEIGGDSYDIAAAKLLDAVAAAIGFEPPEQASDRQKAFALSLDLDVAGDSKRVASARIAEALLAKNLAAVAELDLKPGDRVVRTGHLEFEGDLHTISEEFVVSSIHANGRVYFKGGNGQGAWPTQLQRITE
jgi:hypothetical protein